MKLFKRKDGKISDAQAYLRSTDNVSRPTAILMSIVGFLAVFAIVFSLFLGGRWVFNKLSEDDLGVKVADTSESNGDNGSNGPEAEDSSAADEGRSITVVNGSASRVAENAANAARNSTTDENGVVDGGDEDAGKGVDDRDEAPVVAASELPNTGPGSTGLLTLTAIALAAGAHNLYSRRSA